MRTIAKATIHFQHRGIGQALNDRFLRVPPNQREYAWRDEHVEDLFRDLADAQRSDEAEYFLGMIVLTVGPQGELLIADGQQRLATTSILLAAIRDYLDEHGESQKAGLINDKFLQDADFLKPEPEPKLRLNVADDEFFRRRILSRIGSPDRNYPATKDSHRRIEAAAQLAAQHVARITALHSPEQGVQALIEAVTFIRDQASVIVVTAPDEYDAYRMFETLNDRGVEAAQSDLVKNYLLGRSQDRGAEVQQRWAAMVSVLESAGDDDVVKFLRHFFIVNYGHVREHQLFGRIREKVQNRVTAVEFADALALCAPDYVAIRRPEDEKWENYGSTTRGHIATLRMLRVDQLRPILLAVAQKFAIPEARKAFRLFVSYGVRLLVGGGSRIGRIDRECAERAAEIGAGRITTAKELAARMIPLMPTDGEFQANFAVATISKADLARYVLRALEMKIRDEPFPEVVPNPNEEAVNLEHILPARPSDKWKLDTEVMQGLYKRIGNLALLQKPVNSALGNSPFSEKKKALKRSTFALTADAATATHWDAAAINKRQARMAELAVETWPLTAT